MIKIHFKTHQIAPFKKNSRGACPRTPLTMRMATCKFPNLILKNCPPPPPSMATSLVYSEIANKHQNFLIFHEETLRDISDVTQQMLGGATPRYDSSSICGALC